MSRHAPWGRALPAGDAAVLLEFGDRIAEDVNEEVQNFAETLFGAGIEGIRGIVPGYASLLVEYDPFAWEYDRLLSLLAGLPPAPVGRHRRSHVIPVLYGGYAGPDLEAAAEALGRSPADLVHEHADRDYRIYCLGFSPGFPLCGILPEGLRLPRRAIPRTKVPPGSVAIAGMQTGIYPLETAGGWHLIGRTPLRLFRWDLPDPVPYGPGDTLRFRAVTEEEYLAIEAREASGDMVPETTLSPREASHGFDPRR